MHYAPADTKDPGTLPHRRSATDLVPWSPLLPPSDRFQHPIVSNGIQTDDHITGVTLRLQMNALSPCLQSNRHSYSIEEATFWEVFVRRMAVFPIFLMELTAVPLHKSLSHVSTMVLCVRDLANLFRKSFHKRRQDTSKFQECFDKSRVGGVIPGDYLGQQVSIMLRHRFVILIIPRCLFLNAEWTF